VISFALSGTAVRIIREGNWPNEMPAAWQKILASPTKRRGKGMTYIVTMDRATASDLADYLFSVAEVAQVGEGRSKVTADAARRAQKVIETALKES
jgi:hypothetical protein